MPDDRRNDKGRFALEFSDAEFIDAVGQHQPAGTNEVAEKVGCTIQNADYRLNRLKVKGLVESKKVGNSLVWMLPED